MEYVALVSILILLQLFYLMGRVGAARVKYEIDAPAVTGNEIFERTYRVHQNTLEQLMIFLPGMWLCGMYTNPTVAAVAGLVFIIGRFVYSAKYVADPGSRGIGMGIGFLASIVVVLGALWGVVTSLI